MKNIILLLLLANFTVIGQNLISDNPNFEDELNNWKYGVRGPNSKMPVARFRSVKKGYKNKSCEVMIIKTAPMKVRAHTVFLSQKVVPLKRNKNYEISFYIKARNGEKNVRTALFSMDKGSKKRTFSYFKSHKFSGNGKWIKMTYKFKATINREKPIDLKNAYLTFDLGNDRGAIYIDQVVLKQIL